MAVRVRNTFQEMMLDDIETMHKRLIELRIYSQRGPETPLALVLTAAQKANLDDAIIALHKVLNPL